MEYLFGPFFHHGEIKLNLHNTLNQGSQTRGPREAPMRPANIRNNEYLNEKLSYFPYFPK